VNQISRILVPLDVSATAYHAFDYALAIATRDGAELVLLQAVPPDERFSWRDRERRALAARLRQQAEQAQVPFFDRVQRGEPAEIILLHARALVPDAIVMGTHQRRGLERFRAGSIAEQVVAKTTAPVLVVPPESPGPAAKPFGHVAAAVDFGPGTGDVLDLAAALARGPDDRITLLHVVARPLSAVPAHLLGHRAADVQPPAVRDEQQRLEALADRVRQQTPAAVHARVLPGETAGAIAGVLDEIGAGVVIAGVPQRGILSRALFGTTATRLLRTLDVPVLAVPCTAIAADRKAAVDQRAA